MDARSQVEKLKDKPLTYHGPDPFYNGKTGFLEIWEDNNCCAPTQDFLIAFVCKDCRKVVSEAEAPALLEHLK